MIKRMAQENAARHRPEAGGQVVAPRQDDLAVRAESHGQDRNGVLERFPDRLTGGRRPQLRQAVAASVTIIRPSELKATALISP